MFVIEFSFLPLCSGFQEMLPRLTAMIRGIGDPLVAAYARAYLCKVKTHPSLPSILNPSFLSSPWFLVLSLKP